MSKAKDELTKASREFQRNPTKKNEERLKKSKRAYLEELASKTDQPEDKP